MNTSASTLSAEVTTGSAVSLSEAVLDPCGPLATQSRARCHAEQQHAARSQEHAARCHAAAAAAAAKRLGVSQATAARHLNIAPRTLNQWCRTLPPTCRLRGRTCKGALRGVRRCQLFFGHRCGGFQVRARPYALMTDRIQIASASALNASARNN